MIFSFYLIFLQSERFNLYDITGKPLEDKLIQGSQGGNKISYDFSKYNSGFIIYEFKESEKRIESGKIIKK